MRYILGSVLALIGAAAALVSPFTDWHLRQPGIQARVEELFTPSGPTGAQAGLLSGMLLPMLVGVALVGVGTLMQSRLPVALAGVLVAGVAVLWMIRHYQSVEELEFGAGGVGAGVVIALAGGLLILIGAMLMPGRRGVRPAADSGDTAGSSVSGAYGPARRAS